MPDLDGQLRIVSHGGGVQTTALLVLAATGRIDFRTFCFVNVGDDSEHPATLEYLHKIAGPYAEAHGIELVEIPSTDAHGRHRTIREKIMNPAQGQDIIPVHMAPTGFPASRSCTGRYKVEVLGRWVKARGADEDHPATIAMGISKDEIVRANAAKGRPYERLVYPLICVGDPGTGTPYDRRQCKEIIQAAGLPLPGKSACYFCPFTHPRDWVRMAQIKPELFEAAAEVEDHINARKRAQGRNPVFLAEAMIPLREAFGEGGTLTARYGGAEGDGDLFGERYDPHCDNGWCMT